MPLLNVTLSGSPDEALAGAAAHALSDLTARILRKDKALTAVAVNFVPAAQWFIAGTSLAASGHSSFALDIQVVDGTNTKDEKAAYLAAVFEAMGALLPRLHTESYILVREVKADAYGFGGRTQESRYIARQLAAA